MKKYIQRQEWDIKAIQWFKHGDHPEVHRDPKDSTIGLIDHDRDAMGYPLRDVTVVSPGDYVIKDCEGMWTLGETEFKKEFKPLE